MKMHFIYHNIDNSDTPKGDVHYGLASLYSVLKSKGHNMTMTHLRPGDKLKFVDIAVADVKKNAPDLIGFTLTELEEPYFVKLSQKLKEEFELPQLVGGAYPTIAPERIIRNPGIDMIFRGEAENTLPTLLEKMERNQPTDDVPGTWVKKENRIIKNALDYPPDITTLPFGDLGIFDDEVVLAGRLVDKVRIGYMCNRGCPYSCTYCLNYHIKKCYPKGSNYIRYQKVDRLIENLVYLKDRYKFDLLCFYDDTFTLNKRWISKFSEKYKKEVDLPFVCNARPETCSKEIISMISDAGCEYLSIGLESGNEWIRKNVLKRRTTNEQIITAFRNAKEHGIRPYTFNMVGIPHETENNIMETIRLNAKVKPYIVGVSAYFPFRGTTLGDLCYKEGWILEEKREKLRTFLSGSVMNYPQLSNKKINWYFKNFNLLYNSKVNIKRFVRELMIRGTKRLHLEGKISIRRHLDGMRT
jgi:radical SAM superfamily enzyme YgiQ (UPF0313 family)